VAYVGNQPARGQWRKLSDISSTFDGVITTFTTSVPPGTSQYFVTAGSASQLLISLGGVIQEPDVDYTVSTNSVTFTTPPTSGLSFFGVLCGDALNAGVPSDGSVTTSKLAGGLSVGLTGGSVSTPSLFFTGDDNTGVFSAGADQLNIATNGVERVEFGTSEVVFNDGGANYDFRVEGDTEANLLFVDAGSDEVSFRDDVKIDSSGRLLVGTLTARSNLFNTTASAQLQSEGTTNDTSTTCLVQNNSAGTDGPRLVLGKSNGSSVGSNTIVASGNGLGIVSFQGNDGSEFVDAASIKAEVDGTPGANDMPGRIVLATTADGASSPTERLRITSTGQVRLAGAGITFNGDTAAANELDDYEEGTFTPSFIGSTGSAGSAATLYPLGAYTKIGNTVTFSFALIISNIGSYTGDLRLTGLPFTTTYGEAQPIVISRASVTQVDLKMIGAQIKDSGNYINLKTGTNLDNNVQVSDVNTGSYFMLGGSYRI
jgi:hypothetical protein